MVSSDIISPHYYAHWDFEIEAIPYNNNPLHPSLIDLSRLVAVPASMNHAITTKGYVIGLETAFATGEVVLHP